MEDTVAAPDIARFKEHVATFLSQTQAARVLSERCRDYVNNHQWTKEEEERLRSRGQAPIKINRIAPKVRGLKGLLVQRKTDPKAYPRTQAHEEAAHAVTDALRFVADNTDFDETKLAVAEDVFVEGYGGAIVPVRRAGGEIAIETKRIPWDRIYFDPHSRRHDFKDARYLGVILWMDVGTARDQFGDKVDMVAAGEGLEDETFDDRPRWVEGTDRRKRIRIAQEFYRQGGAWHTCVFSGDVFLMDPQPSPYLDEDDEPICPIELASAYIDRDNDRFGEVAYWLDLQDEINHRRSKALYLLSVRQTKARKGALESMGGIDALKRELSKANGHVEYTGDNDSFEILETGDMAKAQFDLLQHATAEMDAVGFNAQLAGERQGNLSGKAILALQGQGANEVLDLFNRINGWEKRIYRQIWLRVRQFWTAEKWIRVTDDERNLRWAGFNVPITVAQALHEKAEDESVDEFTRKRAAMTLQAMMQAQDPRLGRVITIKNPVAELEVDIILEQALDSVNIQQEQFEMLAKIAQADGTGRISLADLLRLSELRDKDQLIAKIEDREKAAMEAAQQQAAQEVQQAQAERESKLEHDLLVNERQAEHKRDLAMIEIAAEERKAMITRDTDTHRATVSKDVSPIVQIPDAPILVESMDNLAASNRDVATAERDASVTDAAGFDALLAELRRPREVVRDGEGRVVGLG